MQNFKRYGVRFAIIFSAILFGIYHGNIVQTPFAFILGLLLGYITVSYGLKYAIAVHIFNNMVLADFLDRFYSYSQKILPQLSAPLSWEV